MMLECVRDARIVCEDRNHGYLMAWFGGHGIHAYNLDGIEVAFWNLAATGADDAHPYAVEDNMKENMATGDYLELMEP